VNELKRAQSEKIKLSFGSKATVSTTASSPLYVGSDAAQPNASSPKDSRSLDPAEYAEKGTPTPTMSLQ
jgi:hypothetical protein